MQSKNNVLGIAGILLLVIGFLAWIIRMEMVFYALGPMVLGGIMLLVYVGINYQYLFEKITGRTALEGANMVISIVIFLAIIVFLEMLLVRHSTRIDLTEAKKFSLASQSVQLLEGMDEEVHALFLMNPNNFQATERARNLLKLYQSYNSNFTYEVIDPNKNPEKVNELAPVTLGAVYLKLGERHEKVSPVNENNLTNALLKLVQTGQPTVYFTTGHNERSLETSDSESAGISIAQKLLEEEGYKVEPLQIFQEDEIPEDAAMVVSVNPKTPFFEQEIEALRDYLRYGGKFLAFLDPDSNSGLEPLLEENYGIELGNNWIVENNPIAQFIGGGPISPMISSMGDHDIVNPYGDSNPGIIFPIVRSVQLKDSIPDDISATELLKTSQNSWAESDIEGLRQRGDAQLNRDEDTPGPISFAVAVSKPAESKIEDSTEAENLMDEEESDTLDIEEANETRLVVFGDSDFINNKHVERGVDLFINSINWLAQKEDMISIRPKDDRGEPIMVSRVQHNVIFYISLVVLPLCVAIFGFFIYLLKRIRG